MRVREMDLVDQIAVIRNYIKELEEYDEETLDMIEKQIYYETNQSYKKILSNVESKLEETQKYRDMRDIFLEHRKESNNSDSNEQEREDQQRNEGLYSYLDRYTIACINDMIDGLIKDKRTRILNRVYKDIKKEYNLPLKELMSKIEQNPQLYVKETGQISNYLFEMSKIYRCPKCRTILDVMPKMDPTEDYSECSNCKYIAEIANIEYENY